VKNSDYIIDIIGRNPGIRFRDLLRHTKMSSGTLTYHLAILEENGNIKVDHQKTPRYYPLEIKNEDMIIIRYLGKKISQQIILLLLDKKELSFQTIRQITNYSYSAISSILTKLIQEKIIHVEFEKNKKIYRLNNEYYLRNLIQKHMENIANTFSSKNLTLFLVLPLLIKRLSYYFLIDPPEINF